MAFIFCKYGKLMFKDPWFFAEDTLKIYEIYRTPKWKKVLLHAVKKNKTNLYLNISGPVKL